MNSFFPGPRDQALRYSELRASSRRRANSHCSGVTASARACSPQAPKLRVPVGKPGRDGAIARRDPGTRSGAARVLQDQLPGLPVDAPYLDRLSPSSTLQVIGISQDDADATRGFAKRFGADVSHPAGSGDENYPASNAYGITLGARAVSGGAGRHGEPELRRVFRSAISRTSAARAGVAPFQSRGTRAGMESGLRLQKLARSGHHAIKTCDNKSDHGLQNQ